MKDYIVTRSIVLTGIIVFLIIIVLAFFILRKGTFLHVRKQEDLNRHTRVYNFLENLDDENSLGGIESYNGEISQTLYKSRAMPLLPQVDKGRKTYLTKFLIPSYSPQGVDLSKLFGDTHDIKEVENTYENSIVKDLKITNGKRDVDNIKPFCYAISDIVRKPENGGKFGGIKTLNILLTFDILINKWKKTNPFEFSNRTKNTEDKIWIHPVLLFKDKTVEKLDPIPFGDIILEYPIVPKNIKKTKIHVDIDRTKDSKDFLYYGDSLCFFISLTGWNITYVFKNVFCEIIKIKTEK